MGRGETNAKKRKRILDAKSPIRISKEAEINTTKPTAIFQPIKTRKWTVSVALPGSIIANAQSHEQKSLLAGNIARALSVFCIDEIVIFSDGQSHENSDCQDSELAHVNHYPAGINRNEYTGSSDPDHFLVHLLSYLETPPHLRKNLFPLHPNLRMAGTLPSLDLPHHLKAHEWCQYREGVTLDGSDENGTYVEAGLRIPVYITEKIPPKTRLTLKFLPGAREANSNPSSNVILARPVNPSEPREEGAYYWGFKIRRASKISNVFTECEYYGGYDITIGTSERGSDLQNFYSDDDKKIGKFSHLLIVIGGVAGLEVAVRNDKVLQELGVIDARDVFDHWINICPHQGSRTIRTEEALWIGLARLKRLVDSNS